MIQRDVLKEALVLYDKGQITDTLMKVLVDAARTVDEFPNEEMKSITYNLLNAFTGFKLEEGTLIRATEIILQNIYFEMVEI